MSNREIIILVSLGIGNVPIFIFLGKLWFGDWSGFWEAVRYTITPDIITALLEGAEGYWEDRWQTVKLVLFILLCALIFFVEMNWVFSFFD